MSQPSTVKPWRDLYPVHPCADVFPMMTDAEIDALAQDIKKNGLHQLVVLVREMNGSCSVLDGRNRLEALARNGVEFERDPYRQHGVFEVRHAMSANDPAAYVIGANIHRRHLTKEQQAELIVRTIAAGQSNDSAKVARSFNPKSGKKGGSTKDPVLTAAVDEAQKQGISKRTVENAMAKVLGPTRKVTGITPRRRKINSTRIMECIVRDAELLTIERNLIQSCELDPARFHEWITVLKTCRVDLDALIEWLESEHQKHGQHLPDRKRA